MQLKEIEQNFINASGELAKYQIELVEAIETFNNAITQHKYLNAQQEYYNKIVHEKKAAYDLYISIPTPINLTEDLLNSEIDVSAKMKIEQYISYLKDISVNSNLFNSRKNKVSNDLIIKQNIAYDKTSNAELAKRPYLLVCTNTLNIQNGKYSSNINDNEDIISPVYPDKSILGKTQFININNNNEQYLDIGYKFKRFDLGVIDRDGNLYTGDIVFDLDIKYFSYPR